MEPIELFDMVAEDPKLQEILRQFVQEERAQRQIQARSFYRRLGT